MQEATYDPFEMRFVEVGTDAWEALPAEERDRRAAAVLVIQKHFRRHAVCATLEVMNDVTTTMQSLARGYLARKQVKEKRKHHQKHHHHRRHSGGGGKEKTVMEEVRAALHDAPPGATGRKSHGLKGHPSTSQFDGASLEAAIMSQNEEIVKREREQAATKLQAVQRGKKTRQKHHQKHGHHKKHGHRHSNEKQAAEAPAPASPVLSDSPWACFGGRRGKVCGLEPLGGDVFNTPLLNALLASAWGSRACLPLGPREVRSPQVPAQPMPGRTATPESKSKASKHDHAEDGRKKHHRSSSSGGS